MRTLQVQATWIPLKLCIQPSISVPSTKTSSTMSPTTFTGREWRHAPVTRVSRRATMIIHQFLPFLSGGCVARAQKHISYVYLLVYVPEGNGLQGW